MMDDKKFAAEYDEELEVITHEPEELIDLDDDDTEEIEEIDTEDLSDVEAAGGKDGDKVRYGRWMYMEVAPRTHRKCSKFQKGANRFPKAVKDNTCSACIHLFKSKGRWLCAKSKTAI